MLKCPQKKNPMLIKNIVFKLTKTKTLKKIFILIKVNKQV